MPLLVKTLASSEPIPLDALVIRTFIPSAVQEEVDKAADEFDENKIPIVQLQSFTLFCYYHLSE
jgi:hypothetical protein